MKPGITSSIGMQIAGPCQRQILIKAETFFFPSPPHYFLNLERRRDRWREFSLLHKSALSHESHSNCGFIAPRASERIRASSKAALRRGFTWPRSSQCRLSPLFSSLVPNIMAKNYRNIVVKTHSPLKSAFFAIVHSPPISLLSNGRFAESLFFALFGYVLAVPWHQRGITTQDRGSLSSSLSRDGR